MVRASSAHAWRMGMVVGMERGGNPEEKVSVFWCLGGGCAQHYSILRRGIKSPGEGNGVTGGIQVGGLGE